jgi:hypothetical protein
MTAFAAQHVTRPNSQTAPLTQRIRHSVTSIGAIVLDSIEATRAIGSAHSSDARHEVLARFAAETTRDAGRSAA